MACVFCGGEPQIDGNGSNSLGMCGSFADVRGVSLSTHESLSFRPVLTDGW
jgi:hypothetical protein